MSETDVEKLRDREGCLPNVQAHEIPTRYVVRRVARLDPPTCGCTDCLTGYSRPLDEATEEQLLACARGEIQNATGKTLKIREVVEVRP